MAAIAASAPEMANTSSVTRVASMPTSAAPSRFCAMAMMVAPVMVRVRNRCSSTISAKAAPMISRRCSGAVSPNTSTIWP
ncbi:hypothetical protein D3C72_2022640 [compost metagenome]